MCMSIGLQVMCVHHGHAWCSWKPEEGIGSLALEVQMVVSDNVEAEHRSLQEQPALPSTEPSPRPYLHHFSFVAVLLASHQRNIEAEAEGLFLHGTLSEPSIPKCSPDSP